MAYTLNELKAENAAIEAAANNAPVEDKQEVIKDEYVEVVEDVKADDTETELEEDSTEKVELESWQLTEEAEASEDDKQSGFKPNAEYAAKRLKGKLKHKDSELEELKAQVEALRSGTTQAAAAKVELGARPTREQFDYDDDAYDKAVDDWNDKKLDIKLNSHSQKSHEETQQKQQQEVYLANQKAAIDNHYGRAQKLVDAGRVTSESFQASDTNVRRALELINPGKGDLMTDAIISTLDGLGDGSEKVMYQLGVNPAKLQELQSKLASDQSGNAASMFLGQLQAQVQSPNKRKSQAPKPSSNANGEGGNSGKGGTLKKAYDAAGKSGDLQARLTAKRKAKSQNIDVSNW